MIDNYIGLKTLVLLKSVPENVKITIFTDNLKKGLHQKELDDFCKEYPNVIISFKRTNGIFHDRYITLISARKTKLFITAELRQKIQETESVQLRQLQTMQFTNR